MHRRDKGAHVTKKVSWASLAGCCCGWNRASKFQKLRRKVSETRAELAWHGGAGIGMQVRQPASMQLAQPIASDYLQPCSLSSRSLT